MTSQILLIYPPQAIPDQPYSSLPSLTGFLRANGYDVEQRDLNIEAYDYLLSPERLRQSVVIIKNRLAELHNRIDLSEAEQKHSSVLRRALLVASYAIENIESAKQATRDIEQFYQLDRYTWAQRIIERGLEVISAEFYPTAWNLANLRTSCFSISTKPFPKVGDFIRFAQNEKENIFLAYFRDQVLPSVIAKKPRLVGISVTYPLQIIAALTIANLLKAVDPAIHICIGGARVCYDRLWNRPEIFSIVDSVVTGEGEHALLSLIQKLEAGDTDWSNVPNLTYARSGEVFHSQSKHIEDVNSLPTPDWSGLPLEKYFSAEPVLLLPTSRGCYWGKCAFCTVSEATAQKYRPRRIGLVLEDMHTLYQQHGATHFFLSVDAESPNRMKALAAEISSREYPFVWQTETRFSPPLSVEDCTQMYAGGCRYLVFGFESGNQRILDLMKKGTKVSTIDLSIRNCAEAGIGINLQTIMGFPTENEAEAKDTADFILDHRAYVDTFCISEFALQPSSPVDINPSDYGVTQINRDVDADADIVLSYDYQVSHGMKQGDVSQQTNFHNARLDKYYYNPPALITLIADFLYLTHYTSQGFKALKRSLYNDPKKILATKPWATGVVCDTFTPDGPDSTQVFVFNSVSGGLLTLDAQSAELLALCDGQRTGQEIANEFVAKSDTTRDFIIGYSKAISGLKKLLDFGILQDHRPSF